MKNILLIAFLALTTISTNAQDTVMIEFYDKTTGDYDLMIKNILQNNGYESFVNYGRTGKKSNLILRYQTTSRENYDELHTYKFTLLNNTGDQINSVQKVISYFNLGINEPREICKGLSKLFNKKFACNSYSESGEVKYFNILFSVHKIDSAIYSIIARGAGIRPLKDVENAFLKKASKYLKTFDYYYESDEYNYSASGGYVSSNHTGFVVYGIIKPPSSSGEITKITEKPLEFIKEFKD